jgi:chromate transporter
MPTDTSEPPAPFARPQSLWDLFWSFNVLALQGFGGVMAITQRELVERKRWLSREAFLEDWAVAQILPGPNVANLALMLGDRYMGARGALAAVAGLFVVPFMIVVALAIGFGSVSHLPQIQGAMRGLGLVVSALILSTALKLAPSLLQHPGGRLFALIAAAATLLCVVGLRWPLLWVLLSVGGLSCLWTWHRLRLPAQKPT